jgi:hypothetical protein
VGTDAQTTEVHPRMSAIAESSFLMGRMIPDKHYASGPPRLHPHLANKSLQEKNKQSAGEPTEDVNNKEIITFTVPEARLSPPLWGTLVP